MPAAGARVEVVSRDDAGGIEAQAQAPRRGLIGLSLAGRAKAKIRLMIAMSAAMT